MYIKPLTESPHYYGHYLIYSSLCSKDQRRSYGGAPTVASSLEIVPGMAQLDKLLKWMAKEQHVVVGRSKETELGRAAGP